MAEEKQRRRKDRILQNLTDQLPSGAFQRNPYFPEFNEISPYLLVMPAPGRLIAVFLYSQRLTSNT